MGGARFSVESLREQEGYIENTALLSKLGSLSICALGERRKLYFRLPMWKFHASESTSQRYTSAHTNQSVSLATAAPSSARAPHSVLSSNAV